MGLLPAEAAKGVFARLKGSFCCPVRAAWSHDVRSYLSDRGVEGAIIDEFAPEPQSLKIGEPGQWRKLTRSSALPRLRGSRASMRLHVR